MENKMKVSLIMPTYNEAGCIEKTINDIPMKFIDEIIVIDCSTDGTAEIAKRLGCKVFKQEGKGFGQAVRQGISSSKGDIIIIMDADGSHNPKDIPKLINKIKKGYDCVLASRYTIESHSEDDTLIRSFGNWLITSFVNLLFKINTTDTLFLYTIFKKDSYNNLNIRSNGFEYCIEFLVKAWAHNLKMAEVPSIEKKRFSGKSKVNNIKHGYNIIKSIIVWRFRLSKLLKERNGKK